ncbi:hypothetical protein HG826_02565 [Streptomyces sp. GMY01]|uniref:hypothetical protein n=1 Tax=Streptomyces sp. GMY02 TaxID=1333528 RepID=UPI001469F8DC|nr:hypothetical protein [Streptomyces sp. GMY02]NMO32488.1 hypothetical protein [Streptomyces sp. GMY02]
MSGRVDSETPAAISRPDGVEASGPQNDTGAAPRTVTEEPTEDPLAAADPLADGDEDGDEDGDGDGDLQDPAEVARRARWTAGGAGALLALAGLAASLLRLTGAAPAPVGAAYAAGAAVCVLASLLGFRGRTRRALWLMIAGVMVMALGDQFD